MLIDIGIVYIIDQDCHSGQQLCLSYVIINQSSIVFVHIFIFKLMMGEYLLGSYSCRLWSMYDRMFRVAF